MNKNDVNQYETGDETEQNVEVKKNNNMLTLNVPRFKTLDFNKIYFWVECRTKFEIIDVINENEVIAVAKQVDFPYRNLRKNNPIHIIFSFI